MSTTKGKGNGKAYGDCLIEKCPNERRAQSPVCSACAAGFRYAEKKGPTWALDRQDRLEKWQNRMIYIGTAAGRNRKEFRNASRRIQARKA